MATWDDVAGIVAELPFIDERSPHDWRVGKKLIAWERPLRISDREALAALGLEPPEGDVVSLVIVPPCWQAGIEALRTSERKVGSVANHRPGRQRARGSANYRLEKLRYLPWARRDLLNLLSKTSQRPQSG
jgi:hypothetical protein